MVENGRRDEFAVHQMFEPALASGSNPDFIVLTGGNRPYFFRGPMQGINLERSWPPSIKTSSATDPQISCVIFNERVDASVRKAVRRSVAVEPAGFHATDSSGSISVSAHPNLAVVILDDSCYTEDLISIARLVLIYPGSMRVRQTEARADPERPIP